MTAERWAGDVVAYHEAGHAVASWAYGIEVEAVTIVPTEEYAGRVRHPADTFDGVLWDPYRGSAEFEYLRAHAIVNLAGEAASARYEGRAIEWSGRPLDSDAETFGRLATTLGWYEYAKVDGGNWMDLSGAMHEAMEEVAGVLMERWGAVEAVARALMKRGTIDGEELVRMIARLSVPGPVGSTQADFREELRLEAEAEALFRNGHFTKLAGELEG